MPRTPKREEDRLPFQGFPTPEANYYRCPSIWVDICAEIDNLSELKVVQYVLRHTWGYREYGIKKWITTDEFMHGRKKVDGTRMDRGTGLSEKSVYNGIQAALHHGYLEEEVDNTDLARIKRYFCLKMFPGTGLSETQKDPSEHQGPQSVKTTARVVNVTTPPESGVSSLPPGVVNPTTRTTESTLEQTTIVVDVTIVEELLSFGLSRKVAVQLASEYPEEYIFGKIALARWLHEVYPNRISKNAAGYLRRAIEEDYQPPASYVQRSIAQLERQKAENELHIWQYTAQRQVRDHRPPETISGSDLNTETAWERALGYLESQMNRLNFETWLTGTALLSCNRDQALIAVPTTFQAETLESRFGGFIGRGLEEAVGWRPNCRFVVVRDLLG